MYVNGISSSGNLNTVQSTSSNSKEDFTDVLNSKLKASEVNLDSLFQAASEKYGVSITLLKAVAKTESNFNPNSTSHCGAMGIMQLMPNTAKSLGVKDAYDPEQNIMGGAKLLSQLLKEFKGNTTLAVAAYNAGSGNIRKYNGIPPFEETQNYVQKVMGYCGGDDISAGVVTTASEGSSLESIDEGFNVGDLSSAMLISLMNQYKMQMKMAELANIDVADTDDDQDKII